MNNTEINHAYVMAIGIQGQYLKLKWNITCTSVNISALQTLFQILSYASFTQKL